MCSGLAVSQWGRWRRQAPRPRFVSEKDMDGNQGTLGRSLDALTAVPKRRTWVDEQSRALRYSWRNFGWWDGHGWAKWMIGVFATIKMSVLEVEVLLLLCLLRHAQLLLACYPLLYYTMLCYAINRWQTHSLSHTQCRAKKFREVQCSAVQYSTSSSIDWLTTASYCCSFSLTSFPLTHPIQSSHCTSR